MTEEESILIEDLYVELRDQLFSHALFFLKSATLADEAVQDSFHIASQKAQSLLQSPNPQGWMFLTLKNVVRNQLREQKRMRELHQILQLKFTQQNPETMSFVDTFAEIRNSEEFLIMVERFCEGRSYREMAEKRGITEAACRKRIERARKFLQKKLKNLSQNEGKQTYIE